jgi:hypothetical protein
MIQLLVNDVSQPAVSYQNDVANNNVNNTWSFDIILKRNSKRPDVYETGIVSTCLTKVLSVFLDVASYRLSWPWQMGFLNVNLRTPIAYCWRKFYCAISLYCVVLHLASSYVYIYICASLCLIFNIVVYNVINIYILYIYIHLHIIYIYINIRNQQQY